MVTLTSSSSRSETEKGAIRVMIVDDDRPGSEPLCRYLLRLGYDVVMVTDSRLALRTAVEYQPHVVILDFLMPELHGGDVAWQLSSSPELHDTRVIVASAFPSEEIRRKLPPAKIPILEKPIDIDELIRLIGEKTS